MKSLTTATFGVSFPQRWQRGVLEWVKTSSSCKCWQAEGGLNCQESHWNGEQGSRRLDFSVVIRIMVSGWSSPLNWCSGRSFQLYLDEDTLFAYEENNPWRMVWKSVTAGRACFPLPSGTLAGQSVSLELLLVFYLEASYLKTQCINSSQLLKGGRCTLFWSNGIQKEWGCCTEVTLKTCAAVLDCSLIKQRCSWLWM